MAASPAIGRPKIEGLVPINLRILGEQIEALDLVVIAERGARRDPGFNRTDAIREAVREYIDARAVKGRKR